MMKNILNYFFRGLLFVLPIFATFYIILVIANWLDGTLNNMLFSWLPFDIPGLGIVTAFLGIMMLGMAVDRKSTRLNSSHVAISYAVFCLKKKKKDSQNKQSARRNHLRG